MAAQGLPGAGFPSVEADEQARRQQALQAEFPQGRAPFTRSNLLAFGFWGGVFAAAIGGMLNLRRANQRSNASLLLIALVLVLVYWVASTFINDRFLLASPSLFTIVDAVIYLIVSLGFASWIASRQSASSQRWLDLAGKPSRKDQGGCLTMIGIVILSNIVSAIIIFISNFVLLSPALQAIYPPQTYTAQGVSITLPAGWQQSPPGSFNVNCATSGVTCLSIGQDPYSGSTAITLLYSSPGITPEAFAEAMKSGITGQTTPTVAFTAPALNGRDAVTFSGSVNGVNFIVTTVADGTDKVLNFTLNCTTPLQAQCSTLRDQILSTIQFPSSS